MGKYNIKILNSINKKYLNLHTKLISLNRDLTKTQ